MSVFLKKRLIFSLLLAVTLVLVTNEKSYAKSYAIQIKSSENSALIKNMKKSLINKGVPAYSTVSEINKRTYYRLRVGTFLNINDAKNFAAHQNYKDSWIVPDDNKSGSSIICHTFPSSGDGAYLFTYFGKKHPFLIVYQHNRGLELATIPSDMYIFLKGQKKPVYIKDITGFKEINNAIQYGKSIYLYFTPDVKQPVDSLSKIKKISKKTGIKADIISKEIAFYNDGYSARITVRKEYNLLKRKIVSLPKLGFDYVDNTGKTYRWKGEIRSNNQVKGLGNYFRIPCKAEFNENEKEMIKGDRISVFSKLTPSYKIWMCVVFR